MYQNNIFALTVRVTVSKKQICGWTVCSFTCSEIQVEVELTQLSKKTKLSFTNKAPNIDYTNTTAIYNIIIMIISI